MFVNTIAELGIMVLCLLLWMVVLPLPGLFEIGVMVADRTEAYLPYGLVANAAH